MLLAGARTGIAATTLLIFLMAVVPNCAAADEQICAADADAALGLEEYPTAIALHRTLIRAQPNNALAHYHLGFAYGMEGRGPEEIGEYLTSARLGLKNWDLFLNLGLAYLGQHELARAAEALETAVSLGPEHVEAHFNLAIAYEQENRLGEALREIAAARRLAPEDPEAANTNAIICVALGDTACAQDIWRRLEHFAPDYALARQNLLILSNSKSPADRISARDIK